MHFTQNPHIQAAKAIALSDGILLPRFVIHFIMDKKRFYKYFSEQVTPALGIGSLNMFLSYFCSY